MSYDSESNERDWGHAAGSGDIVTAIAAGASLGGPRTADSKDFTVIPDGYKLTDLERFHDTPRRKKAEPEFQDASSLIEYVNKHKEQHTAIYADIQNACFRAVIDEQGPGYEESRFREHRADLRLLHTEEWRAWKAKNKQAMKQVEFAEFLESNHLDVKEPTGAKLLEIALALETQRSVHFQSVVRLSDGARQFKYEDEGVQGQMQIPETFTLHIAPFEGSAGVEALARLRYRIREGALSIWYDLHRPNDVERSALDATVSEIKKATERPVYFGCP